MKRIVAVCERDLRELVNGAAFKVILAAFGLLAVGVVVGSALLVRVVLRETAGLDTETVMEAVKLVVGRFLLENAFYGMTLLPYPLVVWVFAASLVMRDKLEGNIETLLATPLSVSELMIGKTLALSAVSTGIGWFWGILSVLASEAVVSASLSRFVALVPVSSVVAALVLNPLLFSGMCALIVLLALAKDADASILPSFLIGMGMMIGVPAGIGTGVIRIGSLRFCLYQLAASAALWLAVAALRASSKKEAIVLSARK